MLRQAVQQHQFNLPPPSQKPRSALEQQLFSNSPIANHNLRNSPSQQPLPTERVLKPSASSILNGTVSHKNTLKRTFSQASGMGISLSRQAPQSSTSRTPSALSEDKHADSTQFSSVPTTGIVSKLHESVYFDENDFVDDKDLDLDGDDSDLVDYGLSAATELPHIPSQHNIPSSVPLLWSSSPLHHKTKSLNATSQGRALNAVDSCLEDAHARQAKRRTLPWLNTDEHIPEIGRHSNHPMQLVKAGKSMANPTFTPLPKDERSTPYPWNKTASAVKEEQRKHRQQTQQSKKVMKTTDMVVKYQGDVPEVFLSEEQRKILNLVVDENKSVFFTGSAGTGKSVLMRQIIASLRAKYQRESNRVAVTASTGLAACNIGGVTLHNFSGIGLGKEDVPTLVKKIKRNQKAKPRWMQTKVLIIDEISMVDGDLFDKLESIARSLRNNGRPFGGIQLVITGDFFQLPPVPESGRAVKFAFDAATWNTSINHTIGLTHVYRQRDPVFANMLNEMRIGRLSSETIAAFRNMSRKLDSRDDFDATELFPTRNEVENANNMRMKNLGGNAVTFDTEDGGTLDNTNGGRDKLLSNCIAPAKLVLKKGAQVMLIKNLDESLVNGSLGKVVSFMDEKTFDYYHENESDFQIVETQDIDEEALSRRTKLKSMMNTDLAGSTGKKWPLVRFHLADGSFRELLVQRETWKHELPNGEITAFRSQIPLILAWALSIHKAQGQTLDRVKVDLGRAFEKGQAYVALSRATRQEGLQITRFDPKKVMAHEKVRTFYDSLYCLS